LQGERDRPHASGCAFPQEPDIAPEMQRRASLPAGENRKIARPMVDNQPLVPAKPVPPGWKHRLYGRQDARRYGRGGRMRLPAKTVHLQIDPHPSGC